MTFVLCTVISTKASRNLKSNLLNLIKRNKRFCDKKEKEPKESQDVIMFTNNLTVLTDKCSMLEQILKTLETDNRQVLNDNRHLCLEILKSRRDAEIKSEKLMFFMMSLMLKVKNKVAAQITGPNDALNAHVPYIHVDSEFMKAELDSYFEKLKRDKISDEAFPKMLGSYAGNGGKSLGRFPSVALVFKDHTDSDSETHAKNQSQCNSIEDVVHKKCSGKLRANIGKRLNSDN